MRKSRRKTTKQYIDEAVEFHGNKYCYDKTTYITARDKVTITCPNHGDFTQEASAHVHGQGCPSCDNPIRAAKSPEDKLIVFKKLATEKHGDLYDYSKTAYISSGSKVVITCPEHGDFFKTPNKHLSGQGCPSCPNKQGIFSFKSWPTEKTRQHMQENHHIPCKLYLLKVCMDGECFYKVGVTTRDNIGERVAEIRKRSKPSTVNLIHHEHSDYLTCHLTEEILLSGLCNSEHTTSRKFKGYTECFTHESEESLKTEFITTLRSISKISWEDQLEKFMKMCSLNK